MCLAVLTPGAHQEATDVGVTMFFAVPFALIVEGRAKPFANFYPFEGSLSTSCKYPHSFHANSVNFDVSSRPIPPASLAACIMTPPIRRCNDQETLARALRHTKSSVVLMLPSAYHSDLQPCTIIRRLLSHLLAEIFPSVQTHKYSQK